MLRKFAAVLFLCAISQVIRVMASIVGFNPPFKIVTAEFPPYSYQSEKGEPAGLMTEIIREVLLEMDKDGHAPKVANTDIEYYPWPRAFKMSHVKNVMLYPVGVTPEREMLFKWVGPRIPRNIWIYALSLPSKKLKKSDFKGQSIGVTRGYSWAKNIVAIGAIPEESADDRTLIRQLMYKRIPYIAVDESVMEYTLRLMRKEEPEVSNYSFKKVFMLTREEYRTFGFSRATDRELVERFEAAYLRVQKRGAVQKIIKEYFH